MLGKNIKFAFLFSLLGIFLIQCKKDEFEESSPEKSRKEIPIQSYIFLGHIYESSTTIEASVRNIDFGKYNQIWLGGDLLAETTKYNSNLDYLDSLFDLSNPNTLWSLGNHDIRNGNLNWISDKTKRPFFYTRHKYGITFIVLNTNGLNPNSLDSSLVESQYQLIKSVCDTISKSSHLILLSHHTPWNEIDAIGKSRANYNATDYIFNLNSNQKYFDGIYIPFLENVRSRGINVIHISGDYGQFRNGFRYQTNSGINLLGSGILAETPYNTRFNRYGKPDSVLVFTHDVSKRELSWQAVDLNEI